MFKNKKANFELKKENVVVNMVFVVMTRTQVFEVDRFKEMEVMARLWQTGNMKNNIKNQLKMLLDNYRRKNHHYNSQH